ncbi:crotonase/enoyl-CoA hydratase family protein [Sphingorhabdus sp.]|jgi:enoyl-CoA hydratase|uniref:crotonase/enoyl-CoA hydratase family protein n=1 Tax=Sphingorhabdus sp. TaxID=1902408 RepID=UPI0037C5064C
MSATVQITNDIALIRMDDNKANAMNFDMLAALNAALDTAEAEAKAIVLTGREGRFSGGFDLNAFASLGADGVYKLLDAGAELLLRLYGGPLPVVAACTGHAIAMGVFILHACDTRVGTAGDYKIGANEAITGMNLPIFAMELARDRLNPSHLTRAMIQGNIYNPQGALEAGYLDLLAPADEVEVKALAVASQLAQLPAPAYAWNKNAIRKATLDRIRASLGAHHKL